MVKYREIVDLTHVLETGMMIYPGDTPEPLFIKKTVLREPEVHITTTSFHLGSHAGTHMDAPRHFFDSGLTLDKLPLENFMGTALKVSVKVERNQAIEMEQRILAAIQEQKIDWVIIETGWSQFWGREYYYEEAPYLSLDTVRKLMQLDLKGIALDLPSVDSRHGDVENYPVHQQILSHNCLIVENLTNLEKVTEEVFYFQAFPILFKDSEGSPCRAIALLM